ncbi:MAG: methionyl-tRNA formyltransferase [Proteobacteria bacterium]|nr:methionyl-tRNA formyltransferase [Pseudomonadota bacterium]
MTRPLKIAFMGTPEFAVRALDAIIQSGHEVVCVYCQPPRPAGRGHKIQLSPVQGRAEELEIPVRTPRSLKKDAAARNAFTALDLDIAVIAAYGLILPQDILDAPQYGCLNIHASLLPRWRGAAPIQRSILAGDTETGICIMQMEAGLDTGPVLMRGTVPITATTTAEQLHDALAKQGAELIIETLNLLAAGKPPAPQKQAEEGMTYAAMLTKDDGKIDWTKSAADIERQLRALHPWPGVWCTYNGQRLKVLEAAVKKLSGTPGEILDRHMIVACGRDALLLKKIQPQDRKPMDGASFMNGLHLNIGDRLA